MIKLLNNYNTKLGRIYPADAFDTPTAEEKPLVAFGQPKRGRGVLSRAQGGKIYNSPDKSFQAPKFIDRKGIHFDYAYGTLREQDDKPDK